MTVKNNEKDAYIILLAPENDILQRDMTRLHNCTTATKLVIVAVDFMFNEDEERDNAV
ncbi:12179_t:CDS:2 [Ambispora gerdemannii]|uniref:12179_t:CDS:1 n=1 Tax=Ambispora gerdemannii TaxID=144530 RepID=A0A9N9C3J2_9GLOM|nr:12179_t:CDS:2 [Ambispora gerdemannii]